VSLAGGAQTPRKGTAVLHVVDADGPQWGHGARTEFSSWR
jgi:hypothetical protein